MVEPFYKNIRLLVLSVVMIIVWGLASFQALPRQEDPELVARVAVIETAFPGANAERVEALVTEVIEAQLSEVEEIDTLESDSRAGFSAISVTLVDAVEDAQPIWSKVRDEINAAVPLLPAGTSTPELVETDTEAFTAIASLTWQLPDPPNYAILGRYAEELSLLLRGLAGTDRVELFGSPQEEILVEIDAPTLTAVGLSPQALAERIRTSDAKVTAGQFRSPQQNLAIEVESELETLEQIRQIPIQTDNSQFTRLSDIARVNRGVRQPVSDLALTSGQPAVVLGALMKSGQRIDRWSAQVRDIMADFETQLPQGVSLDMLFEESRYVEDRIDRLLSNLIVGALLVVAVTMVTMGWRSALVVGAALPLTTFAVFGWMSVLNVPIHQMSVTGLIIALGLLIDNAIVAVDEIQIELHHGLRPLAAVTKTVNYLKVPLLASTITTVMAFMPIYLLPGGGGEFVGTIALGVILAVVTSLAFSLTIIAALAGRMLASTETVAQRLEENLATARTAKIGGTGIWGRIKRFALKPGSWWAEGWSASWLARPYRWSLKRAMALPLLAIALTFVPPLLGFITAGSLDQQFFPSVSRDQVNVEVEFAAQTAIDRTQTQVLDARAAILSDPAVKDVHWFVGETAPKFYYNITGKRTNQSYYAQALVQLNTDRNVSPIIQRLQAQLDRVLPEARILVRQLEQGPPFDAPVEYRIFGPNLTELRRLGMEVRGILAGLPDVIYARDDLSEALPQLGLTLDEEQAQLAGFSNEAIAQQLEAYLEGSVGGSILESTENLPVRVRLSNTDRASLDRIASLNLNANSGTDGNFRSTATLGGFDLVPALTNIARRDEQRVNTVQAFITAGVLPSVVVENFEKQLTESGFALPPGYRAEFGGERAEQADAVGDLALFFPLLVLVMVVALVLSLSSFRQAAIVGGVAVGSIGMALLSLKVAGAVFGFMAIVGTLGLVGIAINDTVVVLSALNDNPEARNGDRRAIATVVFGATRHVVTTTITTIAGFVPLIVDGGPFWRPLAIAIAGGISGASLMALYFVPAVYALIYRRRRQSASPTTEPRAAAEQLPLPLQQS